MLILSLSKQDVYGQSNRLKLYNIIKGPHNFKYKIYEEKILHYLHQHVNHVIPCRFDEYVDLNLYT